MPRMGADKPGDTCLSVAAPKSLSQAVLGRLVRTARRLAQDLLSLRVVMPEEGMRSC